MRSFRHMFAVSVIFCVVTGLAQGDLTPISSTEMGVQMDGSLSETSPPAAVPAYDLLLGLSDLNEWAPEDVSRAAAVDPHEGGGEPDVQVLVDRSDSVDLCLYALIGLGVLRSGQWVRRSALGCIPDWYHAGGPDQIGHSHAIGPDCQFIGAICFIQPEKVPDTLSEQYHSSVIALLLRKSQFIPTTLASRGPPCMS